MNELEIFNRLQDLIAVRKSATSKASYTRSLFEKGHDHLLKKFGEEAIEVVMASKDNNSKHLARELADLWFHCMVLLAQQGLHPDDVLNELQRRFGLSGLEEKAQRQK